MPTKDEATGEGVIISENIRQCQMCKYFVKSGDTKAFMGQCRLNPPEGENHWPKVGVDDWCGRHKTRPRSFHKNSY
jgi:hypothetical protein